MDSELLHSSSRLWDLGFLLVLSPGGTPLTLALVEDSGGWMQVLDPPQLLAPGESPPPS